jgi:hypothetical protein
MRRFSYAVSRVGGFFLLMLVLGSAPASALPPASGSKCNSNWVNNAGAMDCFIQGEEDVRNGVSHPHYVACTSAGETFCCVDNNHGGQDCEAVMASGKPPNIDLKLAAILDAQETMITLLGRICAKVDCLPTKPGDVNRK